ncbi:MULTISPECIES: Na+/H+ antiporter [unclassified Corallococcus]|uniref:Na+/H+ antiporter n=1 Tax=unclassified Corallococcus TaxID=2685029 RepID=UPI001A8D6B74|nr:MULTISPECIES: Na+/H+ antiporter [unclassified Corallococcus]MBN9686345.1 Na+/H+ antiporter [Corallococcus sp. NCSPR001]WAS82226.1 Na+/H+ antiporter [Corallococcus sp. NCRR]
MLVFEIVIALLLGGAGLAALSRRLGTPYPALVALAGAVLALVPGSPELVLDPELALTLFVAPVLLDAAFDASPRDLRANWRPVASLALGAVVLTVIAVAVAVRWMVPSMPWAAAIALGAIVAPPDAAAATAVLKQLKPPHRLMVILEGESLFNDASALLIYRLALGAVAAGGVLGWSAVPTLLVVTVASVLLGLVLSRVSLRINASVEDVSTAVITQFGSTFAVWILAERLHLSGILTTVVYAMTISRTASVVTPARIRIPSYAVWEVATFVLNVLAFVLVGFQLKGIVARFDRETWWEYTAIAAVVTVAAILARIAWVMGAAAFNRWRQRQSKSSTVTLSPGAAVLVGWCGMRGIVTLAAALALPTGHDGVAAFPYRDLILFTSFSVVLGTLVVQGMTLKPLMTRLKLDDDGEVDHEVRLARVETLRAGLEATQDSPGTELATLVRRRYELQLRRARQLLDEHVLVGTASPSSPWGPPTADAEMVRTAMAASRRKLAELRATGTIGDAAFQQVEQELDWSELDLQQILRAESPE